jgi:phosphoribosylpyrophosphate synthetase
VLQDGFPNLFVREAPRMRDRHVAFLASFHSPGVIFEQLSIIYALPKMFVASFTLVLPFFPTGTAERVEFEGEIATAFTLARILSHVPLCRGGPCDLVIFDIHALQERFYFGDNVCPLFCSGVPLLLRELRTLPDGMNVAIAYPDEGAWKRFHWQFESFPEIICTKVRDGDKRIVRLKEGAPAGRHVVIVDDLVQSGGTLVECARALQAAGAAQVSAYVTHGVFPNRAWERFATPLPADAGGSAVAAPATASDASHAVFTHFWMTDSCPQTVKAVEGRAPFKILSLARPIAEALCY